MNEYIDLTDPIIKDELNKSFENPELYQYANELCFIIMAEYNHTDLVNIIEDRTFPLHIIAYNMLKHKLKNTCLGCLYDKCDQKSHMGDNGCLEIKYE